MAIEIISRPRKLRRFLSYDFEWIPGTLAMRVCGVFDGNEYHHYDSVEAFLNGELTSKNRGAWFYAHAGGLADVQFVLECIVKKFRGSYTVKASFSGSSAIIVHVRRGNNVWHFVDSYWLLKDKLKNIAKHLGMEKTGPEKSDSPEKIREWYAKVPLAELITYNENDCRILWAAIFQFQISLLEYGGQLQSTLASCAMHLFRRKYLKDTIHTNKAVNDDARYSYFASRVEVFTRYCESAYYHDINSSFPFAMTKPLPGNLIASIEGLPSKLIDNEESLFIADVTIDVPDCYLPPVPIRRDGRVFFPTGVWRTWLTGVDIRLLLDAGGKILIDHQTMIFEPFHDLREYAIDLFSKRRDTNSAWEKLVLKYLLNSLYGKFAESRYKEALHVNPSPEVLARMGPDNMLFPGAYLETQVVPIPHEHVPISSYITSIARKTLYDFLIMSNSMYYCDTDGFATDERFTTGKELGDLKLEKIVYNSQFVLPKLYKIEGLILNEKGEWKEGVLVKAKGFSLGDNEKAQLEKFDRLVEFKEVEIERMSRIREIFRKGNATPSEKKITKALSPNSIPKRFTYPDGNTRPWQVRELPSA